MAVETLASLGHHRVAYVSGEPALLPIRQRLAQCYAKVQIMRYNGLRVMTRFLGGHHPGPDGAISKLYWSEYHRVVTEVAVGPKGELTIPRAQINLQKLPRGGEKAQA